MSFCKLNGLFLSIPGIDFRYITLSCDLEEVKLRPSRPLVERGWIFVEGKDVVTVYIFNQLSESYRDLGTLV